MRAATKLAVGGSAVAGAAVLLRPGTRANRWACHELDETGRRMRYLSGRLQGVSYRLRGRRPDPTVIDNVLADRVRSSLGTMEKKLDVPRIHVMVDDHVVMLHGEVGSEDDVDQVMKAVSLISGVVGVESYLHVGLARGDTRPSTSRAIHFPSEQLQHLLDAAVDSGIAPNTARSVVRAILATFADRLPADERDHVAVHLPADVRPLFTPPRRTRHKAVPRTAHDLVARIAAQTGELEEERAMKVTAAVLERFRSLVPEEARDVGAVLPSELRDLWRGHPVE